MASICHQVITFATPEAKPGAGDEGLPIFNHDNISGRSGYFYPSVNENSTANGALSDYPLSKVNS